MESAVISKLYINKRVLKSEYIICKYFVKSYGVDILYFYVNSARFVNRLESLYICCNFVE